MVWILHQNTQLNLIIKDFIIMFLVSRPCWPSGLSCCSNSSRVASKDPGLNPAWGLHMVPKWTCYIPIIILSVGNSNKTRYEIILLIWVVFQLKKSLSSCTCQLDVLPRIAKDKYEVGKRFLPSERALEPEMIHFYQTHLTTN